MVAQWARHSGHDMATRHEHELQMRKKLLRTSRYGCFNASSTLIRFLGLNVRHFSIRSIAIGFAFGNSVENGLFFRKGKARIYSRDRGDEIA